MFGDAGEYVHEPSLGIDFVVASSLDQGIEERRALAAAIGSAEQQGPAA